jgi:uncharacterized membrane protein YccF (DUF307 family)
MKALGNIIWLVLAGIWMAIAYVLTGILMFITIIGIPFGVQAFKLAGFALWPFGGSSYATPAAMLLCPQSRTCCGSSWPEFGWPSDT